MQKEELCKDLEDVMFLKAKDMRVLMAMAEMLGMKTIGEAMSLFSTLKALKAHQKEEIA